MGEAELRPVVRRTHPTMPPIMTEGNRIAALDLGSLTVRLAIAEVAGPGRFRQILHRRDITALGQGLALTGALDEGGMARSGAAIREFMQVMAEYGVARFKAVGTQALRQASNRQVFLDRLQRELQLDVEVLAPEDEARLSLNGVLSALAPEYAAAPALAVIDVGGGSSEFALLRNGQPPRFHSLPLGVLILSQAFPLGDPPEPERLAALRQHLSHQLSTFHQRAIRPVFAAPPLLVGAAGSVTTLAAMALRLVPYDTDKINNYRLTRAQVADLAGLVAGLTEARRARLPGLEPAKAGVMVAGALLILVILEVFQADSLVVIDAGLLEGVLAGLTTK